MGGLCNHDRLFFGSGDYYVICEECHQYWVARLTVGGDDNLGTNAPNHSPKGYQRVNVYSWDRYDESEVSF